MILYSIEIYNLYYLILQNKFQKKQEKTTDISYFIINYKKKPVIRGKFYESGIWVLVNETVNETQTVNATSVCSIS